MEPASKMFLLDMLDYEQQTVQNNNTPSRKYRNKIQYYTLETPTMTTKFIPPRYCTSNGRIPNEILLLGDTLILEHEITPASPNSYTTLNGNPSKNLKNLKKHENVNGDPLEQISILETPTLNNQFIMITGPGNNKVDKINNEFIELINLSVISLLANNRSIAVPGPGTNNSNPITTVRHNVQRVRKGIHTSTQNTLSAGQSRVSCM